MANSIYIVMRKLKGYRLEDILKMYITQFNYLIACISKEYDEEAKARKKQNRKRR